MTTERTAFDCGDYRRFTGYVNFDETEGWAENASFELLDYGGPVRQMVWRKGTWKDGLLVNCMWLDGTFLGGTLACVNWHKGTFNGGTFKGGYWWNGSFNGGLFEHSKWYGGRFNDGTFRYSEWHNGKWHGGKWDMSSFRTTARFYTARENEWLEAGRKQGYIVDEDDD